jgi:SAM-dependent methyltransferase
MKIFPSSIFTFYKKLSTIGKVFFFTILFLVLVVVINEFKKKRKREGFIQNETFLVKKGKDIYDDFYVSIYDQLFFNIVKNDYEVGMILNQTVPNVKSVILDIGCGTGHHVSKISEQGHSVMGIDTSNDMIEKAKKNYPSCSFEKADALKTDLFKRETFTHILCFYFTIYYIQDKETFFHNCYDWLKPGGYLIVHLVNKELFDPIVPPGNPLFIVSPQKYAKERITSTHVDFHDFSYNSKFVSEPNSSISVFEEKIKFPNGSVRKHEHKLFMNPINEIVQIAQDAGFLLHGKIDMVNIAYEYQYLYIFTKPTY